MFRGPEFWDPERGRWALEVLAGSLQVVSLPYYPGFVEMSAYGAPVPEDSSRALLRLAGDREANAYLDVLDRTCR